MTDVDYEKIYEEVILIKSLFKKNLNNIKLHKIK